MYNRITEHPLTKSKQIIMDVLIIKNAGRISESENYVNYSYGYHISEI